MEKYLCSLIVMILIIITTIGTVLAGEFTITTPSPKNISIQCSPAPFCGKGWTLVKGECNSDGCCSYLCTSDIAPVLTTGTVNKTFNSDNRTFNYNNGIGIVIQTANGLLQCSPIIDCPNNCQIQTNNLGCPECTCLPVEATEVPHCYGIGGCPELCQSQGGEDANGCPTLNCTCPSNHGFCSEAGIRDVKNDTAVYCFKGLLLSQKENNQSCQNSFECKTNFCSNGICYDIKAQVDENTSILSRIMKWFKGIFGG